MSWLFSQALVAAYSAASCLDGEQSAQLNVMPTPHKFSRNDKTMDASKLSQFGLTLQVLTAEDGEALLTSFLADFPAKTLVPLEKAQASKASAAECGKKWHGLLAKYDPATSLWKTAQCSLLEDSESSLETWPKWGMTRNGAAYLRPKLAQTIKERESGYWPTPTVNMVSGGGNHNSPQVLAGKHGINLEGAVMRKKYPTPTVVKMWATPTTMDTLPPKSEKALMHEAIVARPGRSKPANLRDQVSNMDNWPTPTARNAGDCSAERRRKSPSLESVAKMYPTPQASDNRDRGNLSNPCVQRRIQKGKQVMLSQSVSEVSGQLNPPWVEWLMGWPIGWTDLKPLVTDKCHCVQQQHLSCLEED